jgi:hypothetical protein
MALHYYLNLYDGNIDRAVAVKRIAQDQFEQFERYLRNSISSLERKGEITAEWEPVKSANLAELSVIGGLYEFRRQTALRICDNKKGYYWINVLQGKPNFNKPIEYQIGDREGEAPISEEDYNKGIVYLEGVEATQFDNLKWGFADIKLRPAWIPLQKGDVLHNEKRIEYKVLHIEADEITVNGQLDGKEKLFHEETEIKFAVTRDMSLPFANIEVIREDRNSVVFYSPRREQINENEQVRFIKADDFIDYNNIYDESNPENKLKFERRENAAKTTIVLQDVSDYDKTVVSNNIRFKVKQPQQNNLKMEKWKIQLKETDENAALEDEQNTLSPLHYFFDENVTIKDEHNKYYVEKSACDQDELQMVLWREPTEE